MIPYDSKKTAKKLDAFLDETMTYTDLPGLAVGVWRADSEFQYKGVRGYADYVKRIPLREDHIFHCASVSKLFTSGVIMKLAEAGIIDIGQRLSELLPDLHIADKRSAEITLAQMLTHTSGLGDCADYHWERPLTDENALKDYVYSDEVTEQEMVWEAGKGFRYSNVAYEILGYLASEYSGFLPGYDGLKVCYEDLVAKELLRPAGMRSSTMKTFQRQHTGDPMAQPHQKAADRSIAAVEHYPYTRQHAPSSTLTSNIDDLLSWGRAHLTRSLYAADTYDKIWTPYAEVPNNGEQMGLGWFIRKQHGYTLYGHEGSDDGFRSSFWICPKLGLVTVVLSNLSEAPVKKINKKLFTECVKE